ncbi:MAG: substrate-binding domain-containing protein [Blautia sp.]|nr:substrate-binding domain-containing protein [Blautia sp.]
MSDRSNPKHMTGVIIPTADNTFFSNLADYAADFFYEQGYTSVILSSGNDAEREKSHLKFLVDSGAEGILCVSGLSFLPEDIIPEGFPLVCLDRQPETGRPVPLVANDDREAMRQATDYLISKGCRNILLMPGYLAETVISPRVTGYEEALRMHGLEPDPGYILNRPGKNSSEIETQELVTQIIQKGFSVDAVITSSDRAAFGVVTALHRVGLYVPEDVKLISFDNSPYSSMASPAITALDRNPRKLAETAGRCLLDMIKGLNVDEKTIVPVSICIRDSTR